jgi:hypothetical protein
VRRRSFSPSYAGGAPGRRVFYVCPQEFPEISRKIFLKFFWKTIAFIPDLCYTALRLEITNFDAVSTHTEGGKKHAQSLRLKS